MALRPKHRIRQVARYVLVFLFFTQAALAMGECMMPASDLAKVMAKVEASGCDGMSLNLCQAHCTADHQSLDTRELLPLQPSHQVILVVPLLEYSAHPTITVVRVARSGDPPIPIRFCSFQI